MTTLRSPRVMMRPHGLQDLRDLSEMWAIPQVVEHISGAPLSSEEVWAKLMFHIGHWQALGFGYWAVLDATTGHYLGMVGFAVRPRNTEPTLPDSVEAGWVLHPKVQSKGIAFEAMQLAYAWADEHQNWDKTHCLISPENLASLKLAARLGFQPFQEVRYRGGPSMVLERVCAP